MRLGYLSYHLKTSFPRRSKQEEHTKKRQRAERLREILVRAQNIWAGKTRSLRIYIFEGYKNYFGC